MPIRFHNDYRHWNTWGDFLAYVSTTPTNDGILAKARHSVIKPYAFTGTRSFDEALDLAYNGWAAGRDIAFKISQPMIERMVQYIERPDIAFDVEGNFYDIGRFCADDPESGIRFENEIVEMPAAPKLIRIVYNNTASCNIDKDNLAAKGAPLAALVELLEFAGNRVQLVVISHGVGTEQNPRAVQFMHTVTVKDFDQPLDMARVIFAVAHPSMMRRLGFRVAELASVEAQAAIGRHYGWAVSGQNAQFLDDYGLTPDLFFGASHLTFDNNWQTPKDAQRWLLEKLTEQGVRVRSGALQ
jgi:hypothetical protein